MAIEALPRRRAPVIRAITTVRQYPVLPISVLMIVLVLPGIFADVVAQHDPIDAEVKLRLIPPYWEEGKTEFKTVVKTLTQFGQFEKDFKAATGMSIREAEAAGLDKAQLYNDATGLNIDDIPDRNKEFRLKTAERNILLPGDTLRKDGVLLTDEQKALAAVTLTDGVLKAKEPEALLGLQVEVVTEPYGTRTFPLGTDKVGRDQLSRIIHGARISLSIAVVSIFVGLLVGVSLGLIAGYFGGNIDHVIMRIVDIKLALPSILLALVIASIMRPSFWTVVFVIALVLWSRFARMVRGETLKVKQLDYISRAKVAGASSTRIMFRHVFPNVVNSMIVLSTLEVGHVILFEASLSFLGVGIPRPDPAWGLMVADGRELVVTAWWVAFFPGLAIMFTVLSMNLFGDWLRDRLDPKLRNLR